jgi:hypothetical protein
MIRRVRPGLENSPAHPARTRDHLSRRLGGVLEVGSPGGAQRHPQRGQVPARSCRRMHPDSQKGPARVRAQSRAPGEDPVPPLEAARRGS